MSQHPDLPPEPSTVPLRPVALAVGGLLAFVAAGMLAVWLIYPKARSPEEMSTSLFPAPTLETRPVLARNEWLFRQQARLNGAAGWMPIDEAMSRIAARGEAAYAPVKEAR